MRNLWVRFRRIYPACYTPLLVDRQDAGDWQSVLQYAQEALEVAHPPHPAYYREEWDSPDTLSLRDYLARAYSTAGDPAKAFELYRPAFNEMPCFDTYSQVRWLADAVSSATGAEFTAEAIDWLRQQGEPRRYLLCQVYLSQNQFDEAYAFVASLAGYQGMEESKLVAKAHLLAAFGPSPDDRMESNLRDLYDKIERGEKEPYRFLRDALPRSPKISQDIAVERAEGIYHRLMQAHIDHGRGTYGTGAYYCAMLGEIALHEGRLARYRQWYEKYMEAYKRFRALRAEMDRKMGPVLRTRLPVG
jgi:tetratricopeptide (TPR) repeat protein